MSSGGPGPRRVWLPRASLLLLLLTIVLTSGPARAHEFRPALLRLTERPNPSGENGSFDLRLVAPAQSTAGAIGEGELTPIVPAHCELRQIRLDCGAQGLVGELGVAGLDRHPVDVIVELRFVDGTQITSVLGPDQPTMTVDGATEQAGSDSVFSDYVALGIEHILLGPDHLLFVLGLVLLVRAAGSDTRTLVWTVTAFTLAHSITLAAATLQLVQVPGPPVEAGIALSILLLARELARGQTDETARDTWSWRYPWVVAFGFGLLHGFGFAGALSEVGLPQGQIPLALLGFNVGVELGQLAVVAVLLVVLLGARALARAAQLRPKIARLGTLAPTWVMGALAFAWTIDRVLGFWG
ncbi:HupE/UreJ family protein [Enhygromyxa salina]|uniref:HupE / UreJ protein n=1 Tax=Enhygromyxa salina TaxID=215803 RepID=A0A2S9Y0G1_9BACT|nr:HupE/UreJ family protein [Enhygromyxa salina]PRP98608.1 HupE / UreJ protein [Enhygromyxa salina]